MKYNANGNLVNSSDYSIQVQNRAFKYGDGLFESMTYSHGKILFFEDHYFRLMGSMRFLRFSIPMEWTPEFLEEEVMNLIRGNQWENTNVRIRMMVYRSGMGKYRPETNDPIFFIEGEPGSVEAFPWSDKGLKLDVFQYHHKPTGRLSNLKTIGSLVYTLATIFADENELDDAFLINEQGNLVEASSSNVFLIRGNELITPPLESGCLKGVVRKQILDKAKDWGFTAVEQDLKPFDLVKSEEVFLTNSSTGIRFVGQYKRKSFAHQKTKALAEKLNQWVSSTEDQTEH